MLTKTSKRNRTFQTGSNQTLVETYEANGSVYSIIYWARQANLDTEQKQAFKINEWGKNVYWMNCVVVDRLDFGVDRDTLMKDNENRTKDRDTRTNDKETQMKHRESQ